MNKLHESILNSVTEWQKREIAEILNGQIIAQVFCMSQDIYDGKGKNKKLMKIGCKGRHIGNIYKNGQFKATIDEEEKMFCRSSRKRLDGFWGFECWCGNDSRLSNHEKGVKGIEQNSIMKEDIEKVLNRIKEYPSTYPIVKSEQEVDGFIIKLTGEN